MLRETEEFLQVCVLLGVRTPLALLAGRVDSHHIETGQLEYREAGASQETVVPLPVEQTRPGAQWRRSQH